MLSMMERGAADRAGNSGERRRAAVRDATG
jgi:hypothetical protein